MGNGVAGVRTEAKVGWLTPTGFCICGINNSPCDLLSEEECSHEFSQVPTIFFFDYSNITLQVNELEN